MNWEQEVMSAAEERASALADGDAERLVALLHEDFRWTSHLGDTYSRAEYIRRNTEGDTAVLCAEVSDVVLSEDGEPESFRMPMTQVWVRLNRRWQCLAGHAGPRRS